MHDTPHIIETDAKFIEAGGLKNGGCFGLFIAALVLVLLFVLAHVLLSNLVGDPMAWWGSLVFLLVVAMGAVFFWSRSRRKQKRAQEQMWQQAMGGSSYEQKTF